MKLGIDHKSKREIMSKNYEVLYAYLKEKGAFNKRKLHPIVQKATEVVYSGIPYKLKVAMAISEVITFTSHLRKNIELFDGTIVPCNSIAFLLAKSGASKDSSVSAIRKAFKPAYNLIEQKRKDKAKGIAEKHALLDGKQKEEWLNYYEAPKDLFPALATPEGLVLHLHNLEVSGIGAGFIASSEISTDLQSNANLTELLKTLSIGYDLGNIPSKLIKATEHQTPGINNMPINGLFFGSENILLYDTKVKENFKNLFSSQLARRCNFAYITEEQHEPEFNSIQELNVIEQNERKKVLAALDNLTGIMPKIVNTTNTKTLKLSEEALVLNDVYKKYCTIQATKVKLQHQATALATKHAYWRVLKMSGTFAILDGNTEITEANYITAIHTSTLFEDDLSAFETELIKESYEVFADFCQYNMKDGKFEVGLHQLRKVGYIPTSGNAVTKLKELIHLVGNYDPERIYTLTGNDDTISVEEIIKTETMGVSFIIFED